MSEFRRFFWGCVITILSFAAGIFLLVLDANAQTEEEDDSGFFTDLINAFLGGIRDAVDSVGNFFGGIGDFLSTAFQAVYDGFVFVFLWIWEQLGEPIQNGLVRFFVHVVAHLVRLGNLLIEFFSTIWEFSLKVWNGEISIFDWFFVVLASFWNLISGAFLSGLQLLGFNTDAIEGFFHDIFRVFGSRDYDAITDFLLEHLILLLPLLIGVGLVFIRLSLLALGKLLGAAWLATRGFGIGAYLSALLPAFAAANALAVSAYGFILIVGLILTIWNYAVFALIPLIQSGSINLLGHLTTAIHQSVSPVGFITTEWLTQFVQFLVATIFFILHLGAFWEILGYTVIGAFVRYVVNRFQITVSLN